ncbi:MAG: endonuclease III [Rikenellaceae bacterium]
MRKQERYNGIIEYFKVNMPAPKSELHYRNGYELLVAVILSAQCTDKRVNLITPALFDAFPTAEAMAVATVENIYSYIKSVSYPNNKAKNLSLMAKRLFEVYDSEIPQQVDELTTLGGVGRKTANVIASVLFNKPAMAVDTHVFRVSHRIGLVSDKATTPLHVEKELIKYFPKELIADAHHWLILHGRYVCIARKPKCEECGISFWCKNWSKGNL